MQERDGGDRGVDDQPVYYPGEHLGASGEGIRGRPHEGHALAGRADERHVFVRFPRQGKLTVKHTQTSGGSQPTVNPKTCVASQTEGGVYTVVGGTGRFHGATGHGKFKVYFAIVFPRLKNGKCNTSQSAQPVSGKISFLAYGPLSVS